MRRILAVAATLLAVGALTCGCGGGEGGESDSGVVAVQFWHAMGGPLGDALDELVEEVVAVVRAGAGLRVVLHREHRAILHGDAASEAFLSEIVGAAAWPGQRHWNMESIYEYGSRAGFWRLHSA